MTARHAAAGRSQRVGPSVITAAGRWLFERLLGGLSIAAAIGAVFGLGYVPYDASDQARAESLLQHGTQVRVLTIEGHVDYESSKGGGWWEVDGIRVLLPDAGLDDWVELTGLGEALMESTLSDEVDWRQGWQAVPIEAGYQAPLEVLYSIDEDGQINAMAIDDVREWVGSDEWKLSLAIGAVCLVVSLLTGVGYLFLARD